jgi:hypothetical protein
MPLRLLHMKMKSLVLALVLGATCTTARAQAPVITAQPASESANPGSNVVLSVTATGATGYQWYKNGASLSDSVGILGSPTSMLSFSNVQASEDASYTVVVSNATGYVTSSPATLTVAVVAPPTLNSPGTARVAPGASLNYAITATGLPYSFGAVGLPNGLSLDTTSGIISGSTAIRGMSTVTLSATNSLGTGTETLTLTVEPSPSLYAYQLAASPNVSAPTGIAIVPGHSTYFSVTANDTIEDAAGNVVAGSTGLVGGADGPAGNARFFHPTGIVCDNSGDLYIADTGNDTIRLLNSAGNVSTLAGAAQQAGGADGAASAARFSSPTALAVGVDGTVYVADTGNQTIRKIATDGTVSTLAGSAGLAGSADGTGSAARFNAPAGIAVDSSGNVYVGDSGNFTVREISPAGVVTTLAGSPGMSGQVDGVGSAARFEHPSGVVVDGSGDVFVADAALREIFPGGYAATLSGMQSTYHLVQNGVQPVAQQMPVYPVSVVPMTQLAIDPSGDLYWVNISNGTSTDAAYEAIPYVPLAITSAPQSQYVFLGDPVTLSIAVTGSDPGYAWYPYGFPISGGSPEDGEIFATSSSFSPPTSSDGEFPGNGEGDSGTYDVLVYNAGGFVSSGATIALLGTPGVSLGSVPSVGSPETITSTIYPAGYGPPISGGGFSYQWTKDGVAILGATSSTLTFPSLAASDAGDYTVIVTTTPGGDSRTGSDVILYFGFEPSVTAAPQPQTVYAGQDATFAVAAAGTGLTYQWQFNGIDIPGATGPTLTVTGTEPTNVGNYSVTVIQDGGSVTTIPVLLSVNTTRLINLSARGVAGTGADALIVGFVTSGPASMQLLIRGIGPALAAFGVVDPLADPQLNLYDGSEALLATNAGWGGDPSLAAAFAQTGAFSLPSNSADSALLVSEADGAYTAQVDALSGSPGDALAEVYDADAGTPTQHLLNLSVRGSVATGPGILIGGFVITGNSSEKVLLRGIGPGLASFGLAGILASPQLTLLDSNGNVMATNKGWGGDATLSAIFAQVGAFPLSPASEDTAIVATLAPGNYTVQLAGVSDTTGIGLLEIYEVR